MQDQTYKDVTVQEGPDFIKNNKQVVLLDVRQPEEYREGHIPGSIHIPLGELEDKLDKLDQNQEYLLICRSGRRSVFACEMLSEHGFEKLFNLQGGMLRWSGDVE